MMCVVPLTKSLRQRAQPTTASVCQSSVSYEEKRRLPRRSVQNRKGSAFMQTIQMLRQLTQVDGVAGGEDRALAVAQEICENLGECSRTIQKSLVCQVMPPQEGRPHLLLDAHIDEIGLTVTHIEDNGFLRVGQAGGVDRRLLMASQVVVHTAQGDLPGVVGSVWAARLALSVLSPRWLADWFPAKPSMTAAAALPSSRQRR